MLFQDGSSRWVHVLMVVDIITTHIQWFVDVIVSDEDSYSFSMLD